MLNNCTFLYVEDDKDAQEKMKLIFEDDVKEFYQAFDGNEGLDMYKKYRPDMILTDVHMPILDGLSMSKEIKNIDPNQVIIIISAFDDTKTLLEAIDIGVNNFISKPIDIDKLNHKLLIIAQHIKNKRELVKYKKAEVANLYNLAHFDTLTKIPNRLFFDIKLDEAISRAKRNEKSFALFIIDLDNFKSINDTYGHSGGDKVLEEVSKNIKQVIRLEDTFARIGGDEFALIIECMQEKDYMDTFANKVLSAASNLIKYDDKLIKVTCSIGISKFPYHTNSKEKLVKLADMAMYRAKKSEKNSFSY